MGYNVVYGDTDSIMVNSGTRVLADARAIALEVTKAVNSK
jgi:DNA polymerase elongation subunit (family B)